MNRQTTNNQLQKSNLCSTTLQVKMDNILLKFYPIMSNISKSSCRWFNNFNQR